MTVAVRPPAAAAAGAGAAAPACCFQPMIEDLMAQARADDQMDRRGAARYPFFRPATLHSERTDLGPHLAFTRELSTNGIGLLHNVPLEPGLYSVTIQTAPGQSYPFPTEILWCRPCGEGWHLSGGRFVPPA